MITQLHGRVIEKELAHVVVDVHGVGYEVFIPLSTYDRLQAHTDATLFTKLIVREDLMQLYGFATRAERQLFELITGAVSGIGPKLGLNILSAMGVAAFCRHIVNSDTKALCKINGIGKRSAERLVVELKDKIHQVAPDVTADEAGGEGEQPPAADGVGPLSEAAEDAVDGLVTLGIKPENARRTVHAVAADEASGVSSETLIRKALAALNS
jgi:Holliday junction DNA helicase RuvA